MTMNPTDIPLGVCCCPTVKHATSPRMQEQVRELVRAAQAQGKTDLADCYAERLTRCPTAYNSERVAS
jgi:hypothetical protein